MKPYELMTPKQVAAALQVSERTIMRRVRQGFFPAPALILGRPRWRRETVEKYVDKAFKDAGGIAVEPGRMTN